MRFFCSLSVNLDSELGNLTSQREKLHLHICLFFLDVLQIFEVILAVVLFCLQLGLCEMKVVLCFWRFFSELSNNCFLFNDLPLANFYLFQGIFDLLLKIVALIGSFAHDLINVVF